MNVQTAQRDNPYNHIIRLGRLLNNHSVASAMAKKHPAELLGYINFIEKNMRFTPVAAFFSLFPPIKRYEDDGIWDYHSTVAMIEEEFGTHFGKDDFKQLIMTRCYENKFVQLMGLAFMMAVSQMNKQITGQGVMEEFMSNHGVQPLYLD